MSDVTRIFARIEAGDPAAAEQLLPLVYDELRKLAAAKLAHEKPGQSLQATALVHEAYLRLVGSEQRPCDLGPKGKERVSEYSLASHPTPAAPPAWHSRGHFFAAAAEAMRRILVEQARRKGREKHGGLLRRVEFPDEGVPDTPRDEHLIMLDEALGRLKAIRPQAAQIVQLRYFGGQTVEEAAVIAGISERTAHRLWVFAQAWLRREMELLDEGKS